MNIDYDKIASEYAHNRKLHPKVLVKLISSSKININDRVLEVGCGTGNYIISIKNSVNCSCLGIDPSTKMLSKAEERSDSIHFELGNAESLGLQNDFLNLVFSVDVIHHLINCFNYFQEAFRVLKPGGKVCTVTDSEWIIRNRQPLAKYFPGIVEVELRRYPRISQLRDLMDQVGFRDVIEMNVEHCFELKEIKAFQDKAFSSLHLISEEAFNKGISRMKRDLQSGPILCVSRYLLLWGTKY